MAQQQELNMLSSPKEGGKGGLGRIKLKQWSANQPRKPGTHTTCKCKLSRIFKPNSFRHWMQYKCMRELSCPQTFFHIASWALFNKVM